MQKTIYTKILEKLKLEENQIFDVLYKSTGYSFWKDYIQFCFHKGYINNLDIKGKNIWTQDMTYIFYDIIDGKADIVKDHERIPTDDLPEFIIKCLNVKENEIFRLQNTNGNQIQYKCRINKNRLEIYDNTKGWRRMDAWFYELLLGQWHIVKQENQIQYEPNTCPICGSHKITKENPIFYDKQYNSIKYQTIYYPCYCQECSATFDENHDFKEYSNIEPNEQNEELIKVIKITEKINKNATEMMKEWLAHTQEKPQHLTVEQLCDILQYKTENPEADIPNWVYLETFNALLKAYGPRFAYEDGVKIN